ncbi:MAG: HDIG domain-containing protein [Candidatus Omnitrophica bacterium]|nr:HDIG domain-containing protein [Candidatus Omnitrophota bacterium]
MVKNKRNFFWRRNERLFLLTGLGLTLIISGYFLYFPHAPMLNEGKPSVEDVYADRNLIIQAGIDEVKTGEVRELEAARIKDIYDLNFDAQKLILADLNSFFDKLSELKQAQGLSEADALSLLKGELSDEISDWDLKAFLETQDISSLRGTAITTAGKLFTYAIVSDSTMDGWVENGVKIASVRDLATLAETDRSTTEIMSLEQAVKKIEVFVSEKPDVNRRVKSALTALIRIYLKPNLYINREETIRRREEAKNKVAPILKNLEVNKGMKVADKGLPITREQILILKELNRLRGQREGIWSILGLWLVTVVSLALLCLYLKLYEPKIYTDNKQLYLLSLLVLMAVFSAEVMGRFTDYALLIPIPAIAMLISMLVSPRISFVLTAMLSLFAGMVTGGKFEITLVSLLGGLVGIYSVIHVRLRSHILRAGLLTGIANLFCILALGWLNHKGSSLLWKEAGLGMANGLSSSFIVMGLLPVFESIFKMTTNIRLLELTDMSRPALKELILKAPGTYYHSLIVGNLAESACEAIGANSLLARVGSYYHDLGKIDKSEYFLENQTGSESRHDNLTPTMSRLIILNHTRRGLELAKKYNLDHVLVNFITEHHGTGLMYFFYQRALEEIKEGVSEISFRYPGPKPQSKESAIVLLADSVEAASRTLSKPSHSKLKEMVHEVINSKFIDGQLDECELTLKDFHLIAESFVRVLQGRFHTRISSEKNEGEEKHARAKDNDKKPESGAQDKSYTIEEIYKKGASI